MSDPGLLYSVPPVLSFPELQRLRGQLQTAQLADDAVTAPKIAAGAVGDSELAAAIPRGVLGIAPDTTGQSGITTEVDLTALSIAVTVGTSRRIRITVSGAISRTVVDGTTEVRIKEGATQLQQIDVQPKVVGDGCSFERSVTITPTAGAHTYKATCVRVTGTGSTALVAAATNPAFILVEDIGAA